MSDEKPIGSIVDGLGIDSDTIGDDDLVAGGVVILKIVDGDGGVRLWLGWSDGMSWIERLGMLRAAERIELPRDPGESS